MYNLHSHSLLSDGDLLPSEIAVRYMHAGYKTIAITDHADYSNIEFVIKSILKFTRNWPKNSGIKVLPGVELTHLPLKQFAPLAKYARKEGIKIIVGHGESPVEPVIKGTNRAALEADIDILAHPGLIADSDAKLASKKGIFLEITSRKGHARTNSYVVKKALEYASPLILSHDSHSLEDIISPAKLSQVGAKAGLSRQQLAHIYRDVEGFIKGL